MINTLKRATKLAPWLSVAAILATAAPAFAQAPSQAQRDAIKSQCRSDYMAHCSSVPPGGEASLQCLQKNMSSLSSSCQSAVRAVEAPAAATAKPADTAAPKAAAPAAATAAPSKSAEPKAAAAAPAGQPSSAQISAIRSACRSDYPKVCAGVPTGGAPALQCLEKNKAKLSAGCEKAVSAASGGAAPAAAPAKPAETAAPKAAAPAAATAAPAKSAEPKAAAAPAAGQPTSAQISAIRSACRSDYPNVCAGVPTGGAPALQCLEKNKAKLSAGCEKAVSAASGGGTAAADAAPAAAGAAAAAAPAAPAVIVLRPMRPREELFVLRSACGADVRSLCGGVAPGGGRILQCLATNAAQLSPACKDVLSQFAAR